MSIAAGLVWYYLFNFVSPFENGHLNPMILSAFCLSLGIAICGLYTLISYRVKLIFQPFLEPHHTTRVGLRQGSLLGGGIALLTFLSLTNAFNLITFLFTIGSLITTEIYFRQ